MNIIKMLNKAKDKYWYYYEYGRGPGQRPPTGIFTYAKPSNQIQRNHNKEALALLEVKKSERIIEQQSVGSSYIPQHKFKPNFLDYYQEYVDANRKRDNRHLPCSLTKFKQFIKRDFISPKEINENLCTRFRQYLLETLTGETPQNYYARFKWVIKAATKDKYFHQNPTEEISALRNPSTKLKDNLEIEEYKILLDSPLSNEDVKCAFLFSLYTGLRWCDVAAIRWREIEGNVLTTRIIQEKTGLPVILTLHPLAKAILEKQRIRMSAHRAMPEKVFTLPTLDGANKLIKEWVVKAGIAKHITFSCARLSFSILLQDKNVDLATVAYLMGHSTTKQVERTYKRHRPKNQIEAVINLPMPDTLPSFLYLPE